MSGAPLAVSPPPPPPAAAVHVTFEPGTGFQVQVAAELIATLRDMERSATDFFGVATAPVLDDCVKAVLFPEDVHARPTIDTVVTAYAAAATALENYVYGKFLNKDGKHNDAPRKFHDALTEVFTALGIKTESGILGDLGSTSTELPGVDQANSKTLRLLVIRLGSAFLDRMPDSAHDRYDDVIGLTSATERVAQRVVALSMLEAHPGKLNELKLILEGLVSFGTGGTATVGGLRAEMDGRVREPLHSAAIPDSASGYFLLRAVVESWPKSVYARAMLGRDREAIPSATAFTYFSVPAHLDHANHCWKEFAKEARLELFSERLVTALRGYSDGNDRLLAIARRLEALGDEARVVEVEGPFKKRTARRDAAISQEFEKLLIELGVPLNQDDRSAQNQEDRRALGLVEETDFRAKSVQFVNHHVRQELLRRGAVIPRGGEIDAPQSILEQATRASAFRGPDPIVFHSCAIAALGVPPIVEPRSGLEHSAHLLSAAEFDTVTQNLQFVCQHLAADFSDTPILVPPVDPKDALTIVLNLVGDGEWRRNADFWGVSDSTSPTVGPVRYLTDLVNVAQFLRGLPLTRFNLPEPTTVSVGPSPADDLVDFGRLPDADTTDPPSGVSLLSGPPPSANIESAFVTVSEAMWDLADRAFVTGSEPDLVRFRALARQIADVGDYRIPAETIVAEVLRILDLESDANVREALAVIQSAFVNYEFIARITRQYVFVVDTFIAQHSSDRTSEAVAGINEDISRLGRGLIRRVVENTNGEFDRTRDELVLHYRANNDEGYVQRGVEGSCAFEVDPADHTFAIALTVRDILLTARAMEATPAETAPPEPEPLSGSAVEQGFEAISTAVADFTNQAFGERRAGEIYGVHMIVNQLSDVIGSSDSEIFNRVLESVLTILRIQDNVQARQALTLGSRRPNLAAAARVAMDCLTAFEGRTARQVPQDLQLPVSQISERFDRLGLTLLQIAEASGAEHLAELRADLVMHYATYRDAGYLRDAITGWVAFSLRPDERDLAIALAVRELIRG